MLPSGRSASQPRSDGRTHRRSSQGSTRESSLDTDCSLGDEGAEGAISLVEVTKRSLVKEDGQLGRGDFIRLDPAHGSGLAGDRHERHHLAHPSSSKSSIAYSAASFLVRSRPDLRTASPRSWKACTTSLDVLRGDPFPNREREGWLNRAELHWARRRARSLEQHPERTHRRLRAPDCAPCVPGARRPRDSVKGCQKACSTHFTSSRAMPRSRKRRITWASGTCSASYCL